MPGLREGIVRHPNIQIIISFVRALGPDLLGINPLVKSTTDATAADSIAPTLPRLVDEQTQERMLRPIIEYFDACGETLVAEHSVLRDMEKVRMGVFFV
jgi:hypothetical protein